MPFRAIFRVSTLVGGGVFIRIKNKSENNEDPPNKSRYKERKIIRRKNENGVEYFGGICYNIN